MNFEEFLDDAAPKAQPAEQPAEEVAEEEATVDSIDVQKAVVEALAADKAEQAETISALRAENAEPKQSSAELKKSIAGLTDRAGRSRRWATFLR